MSFVIRARAFFFDDEYNSPVEGAFRTVRDARYDTREAAEAALAERNRRTLRSLWIGQYLVEDRDALEAVFAFFRREWPDERPGHREDLRVPSDATDAQLDELLRLSKVTFAEVFEVRWWWPMRDATVSGYDFPADLPEGSDSEGEEE